MPNDLYVKLPEHDTTLSPTWAVRELEASDRPWQLLVRVEPPGIDPDGRGSADGWEATPHQRFERLLRETGVFAGLLVSERKHAQDGEDRYSPELRLIYAPRGETSGHLTFPLRELGTVAGRPMLGGLKLLLDSFRLFADAPDRRLPALLKNSREAQAGVSTALAEQVLGALHEFLRGLDAAEPDLIRRDLLPSRTDGRTRQIYETSYSVRGLYARLTEDAALNPDTMDERRGGWGRLLALFRLIHKGHQSHFVQARGGKLFDPDQFPFLEGRADRANPPRVPAVSDGCLLRILEGLMTLQAKGGTRERLSYRTLDVEQIGSVYETAMGFTVETTGGRALAIRAGKNNRTPVFVDLDKLATAKGKDRIKFLKEEADRSQLSTGVAKAVEAAKGAADLAAALDPIVDERGSPKKHEIAAGLPILQPTDERRRTGSHYTPRSLTEPIVRHALEPAFDRLGANATPEQILDLKVCDPAMGSGAFLVEACRAIAARLVKAWEVHRDKKPVIPPDEDEELHARRLVAQRCLYGVDKNPLATDLAKLSLWLATLARDHEFTFLDHVLKSGDSLVGLTQAQIAAAHWHPSKPGLPLFRQLVKDRVAETMKGRGEIQAAPDDTARAIQEQRHKSLEARLKDIRVLGDAVIAAFFAEDKPKAREKKRADVESWLTGSLKTGLDKLHDMAATLKRGPHPLLPFHWEVEFPEVFARENAGFDAIIGNPPFRGGSRISGTLGRSYLDWLLSREETHGNSDLVAYFFRRAFDNLRSHGCLGLIATNTIAQGDTRTSGLTAILHSGASIVRAIKRLPWPGEAAVIVSVIHILKGKQELAQLDGRSVRRISAYLIEGSLDDAPARLAANDDKSFKGSYVFGMGFTFDDVAAAKGTANPTSLMSEIILKNPACAERIFPYLGGVDVNNSPTHSHSRYVIDFGDLSEIEARSRYPELMHVIETKVKPQRAKDNREAYRKYWWRFAERQTRMLAAISGCSRVLAIARVTPLLAFTFLNRGIVYNEKIIVFPFDHWRYFGVLQSRIHETWVRAFTSTLKDDLNYAPTDCFDTFPLPEGEDWFSGVDYKAERYFVHRAALMVARNDGMTKTYHRFDEPIETAEDIWRLRELHAGMDRSVLEAYDWRDLAARAAPVFLDETNEDDHTYQGRLFWPSDFRDEVLARLLTLNAERHAEEVRLGIAPGVKRKSEDDKEDALEDD